MTFPHGQNISGRWTLVTSGAWRGGGCWGAWLHADYQEQLGLGRCRPDHSMNATSPVYKTPVFISKIENFIIFFWSSLCMIRHCCSLISESPLLEFSLSPMPQCTSGTTVTLKRNNIINATQHRWVNGQRNNYHLTDHTQDLRRPCFHT